MPLVKRILLRAHTIRRFRLSALARYREAQHMALLGHRLASIYLWGYCAEMLLKAAYFRLGGWSKNQPIAMADLQEAKQHATVNLSCAWPGNLHYLPGWKDLLTAERRELGVPYSWNFARSLNAHVIRLGLQWNESLRYHEIRPFRGEVRQCEQAATWLLGQFRFL